MNTEFCEGIECLLEMFEDSLTPAEALYAKLTSQISTGITKERLKLNMSQAEFASVIGKTQPIVSRWESGDCNLSIKKIAEIAAALDLDVNITLLNASETRATNQYCGSLGITKTIQYTLDTIHSASQNRKYHPQTCQNVISANFKEENDYVSVC